MVAEPLERLPPGSVAAIAVGWSGVATIVRRYSYIMDYGTTGLIAAMMPFFAQYVIVSPSGTLIDSSEGKCIWVICCVLVFVLCVCTLPQ